MWRCHKGAEYPDSTVEPPGSVVWQCPDSSVTSAWASKKRSRPEQRDSTTSGLTVSVLGADVDAELGLGYIDQRE